MARKQDLMIRYGSSPSLVLVACSAKTRGQLPKGTS